MTLAGSIPVPSATKGNNMPWKYGMIKIFEEDGEDIAHLVELYTNDNGEYTSFGEPHIASPEALRMALRDVERDGVNTYFYENGKFHWDENLQLKYTKNK